MSKLGVSASSRRTLGSFGCVCEACGPFDHSFGAFWASDLWVRVSPLEEGWGEGRIHGPANPEPRQSAQQRPHHSPTPLARAAAPPASLFLRLARTGRGRPSAASFHPCDACPRIESRAYRPPVSLLHGEQFDEQPSRVDRQRPASDHAHVRCPVDRLKRKLVGSSRRAVPSLRRVRFAGPPSE